jgi:hypothetical protein
MKIVRTEKQLTVRDNPMPFWSFYFLSVLGGACALWLLSLLILSWVQEILISAIALGSVWGGFYQMKKDPASVVVLDAAARVIRVQRWGVWRGAASSFSFSNFAGCDVESCENPAGGEFYRPVMAMHNGGKVPVSLFWYASPDSCKEAVEAIRSFMAGKTSR